uniref:Uncharacterized protein n=1 Tax=Eptatretus burgeri TaxID=7764 RepID=A0A8C4Q2X9_EPTBU
SLLFSVPQPFFETGAWNFLKRCRSKLKSYLVDAVSRAEHQQFLCLNLQFVEFRRRGLQEYLRLVCNKLLQASPDFAATPSKAALVQILPFFVDLVPKQERRRTHRRLPRLPRLPRQPHDTRQPEPQSGDL